MIQFDNYFLKWVENNQLDHKEWEEATNLSWFAWFRFTISE